MSTTKDPFNVHPSTLSSLEDILLGHGLLLQWQIKLLKERLKLRRSIWRPTGCRLAITMALSLTLRTPSLWRCAPPHPPPSPGSCPLASQTWWWWPGWPCARCDLCFTGKGVIGCYWGLAAGLQLITGPGAISWKTFQHNKTWNHVIICENMQGTKTVLLHTI